MYVVYTDYTGKAERQIEAVKKEKDPILFGVFLDPENKVCVDRFYYLADWEDEYCDLTLDKMVNETAKLGRNIVRTLQIPKDIDSLRNYLKAHYEVGDGSLMEYKVKADLDRDTKPGFFKRIRTAAFSLFRRENA